MGYKEKTKCRNKIGRQQKGIITEIKVTAITKKM